jgi:hypothetical protein
MLGDAMADLEWTAIGSFGTGLDADIARELLIAAEIPVLVRSERTGLFGPAFQGAVPGGVSLVVPAAHAERARELLASNAV